MKDLPEPEEAESAPSTPPQGPSRRLLLAGAGMGAVVAGAAAAWWTLRPQENAELPLPEAFWKMGWDDPKGQHLRMEGFKGRPLLINFWATWCAPCVEELPLINAFYQQNKSNGWQVLGLAIDRPAAVATFLKKMPLDFPIGLAGLSGSELAKNFGNVSEALPFSVAIDSHGRIVQRKLGRLRPEDLQAWAALK